MGHMIILVHCTFTLHPLHSVLARRASEFTTEWSQVRLPVKHRTILGKLFTPLVSLSPCSIFYVPRKKEKITVGNGRGVVYLLSIVLGVSSLPAQAPRNGDERRAHKLQSREGAMITSIGLCFTLPLTGGAL